MQHLATQQGRNEILHRKHKYDRINNCKNVISGSTWKYDKCDQIKMEFHVAARTLNGHIQIFFMCLLFIDAKNHLEKNVFFGNIEYKIMVHSSNFFTLDFAYEDCYLHWLTTKIVFFSTCITWSILWFFRHIYGTIRMYKSTLVRI